MEIVKPLAFLIAALVFSVFLKDKNREVSMVITLTASAAVLVFFSLKLGDVFREVISFFDFGTREAVFAELIMKILGISLITEEVETVCKDAGETSLGKNAVLIGKLSLLMLCIPLIKDVLSEVMNIVTF